MSSEGLHAPRERLSRETLSLHHAIVSIMEELEAVDWYRQRADDCEDAALREILLHNMREEMEHACMALEWLRRNNPDWAEYMQTYLFTEAPITEVEEEDMGRAPGSNGGGGDGGSAPAGGAGRGGFTIGAISDNGEG
ncbi:encapsulin-associated ferritin-like protein [Roseospira navarrensis]|uniref:encapsulin-associated ferritin-like protein n=1 Tax=Roseospira navarrensis TaxID=140058 RepID=UPI001FE8FA03|nr:encapsulin-associated ferritin-like protein [Roseospira navarrensis]